MRNKTLKSLVVTASFLCLLCWQAGPAAASGLLHRLPPDGGRARYDVEGTVYVDGKPLDKKRKYSISVSSVGKVMENGEECRWIEINSPDGILKVLVAEKNLKPDSDPLRHIIRGWGKKGDNKASAVRVNKNFAMLSMLFFPGALNDVKDLEPKLVESKLGKLKCKGFTGRSQGEQGTITFENIHAYRLHDKAPFGVVTGEIQQTILRDGKIVRKLDWTYKLADFGKDAKSKLLEQN